MRPEPHPKAKDPTMTTATTSHTRADLSIPALIEALDYQLWDNEEQKRAAEITQAEYEEGKAILEDHRRILVAKLAK